MIGDPVLDEMAGELRGALVARGLDPKNPPITSEPPTDRMWQEYKKRGGSVYADQSALAAALIERVGTVE